MNGFGAGFLRGSFVRAKHACEKDRSPMFGHRPSPNTKTAPGRSSLNGRGWPSTRLHFISTSSVPTIFRSRSMHLDGPIEGSVSSSSHEHTN